MASVVEEVLFRQIFSSKLASDKLGAEGIYRVKETYYYMHLEGFDTNY